MPDKPPLRDRLSQLGDPPRPSKNVLGARLPPPVPPDATPRAVHPQRAPTHVGLAPPAPQSAPGAPPSVEVDLSPPYRAKMPPPAAPAPPRSLSPSPVSVSSDGVRVRWSGLRKAVPWLVVAFFSSTGFFGGIVAGIKASAVLIATINARSLNAQRDVASLREDETAYEARVNARVAGLANAWQVEADANRTERGTALNRWTSLTEDLEKLKKSVPRIEGLTKPPK